MFVLNKKRLATNDLRKDALEIIESGYLAIDIENLLKKRFRVRENKVLEVGNNNKIVRIDLRKYQRVFVIGFGKGSYAAVSLMVNTLGKNLYKAISLDTKASFKSPKVSKKLKAFWGTHPTPSKKNVEATKEIISAIKDLNSKDLVIYFIGGGGSSLLCGSQIEARYSKWLFKKLTQKGANIEELNIVRKHISEVKGGNLSKLTYPADSISLIVSDVIGNSFKTIASGPTVFDSSTIKDALMILRKYKISLPKEVSLIETPKEKKYFSKCKYFLLASNKDAALAMKKRAKDLGYKASIESLAIFGEARKVILPFVKKIRKKEAIILAGETTVKIKGNGKGGRNQEVALSVLSLAQKKKLSLNNLLVASFSSDGFDNTPVAGAIVDKESLAKSQNFSLDPLKYLDNNDSYNFFQKIGDFIKVRRRAFNVSDLMLVLRK